MDINRKYIIIFGTLILSLVIITGVITYHKEKTEQAQIPEMEEWVLSFPRYYPDSFEEFLGFIDDCKRAVLFSDIEELKDKEIKEIACVVGEILPEYVDLYKVSRDKPYLNIFYPLNNIFSFKPDGYIGISVDLKDVVRKYNPALLEQEKLYFCSISEPSWVDPFVLQIEPKQDLIFNEGDISCAGSKMDVTHSAIIFPGFIPQAESFNIKHYLVDEQTVSDVMSRQSFSEIKEILSNYPIVWQMEKPITP